MRRAILTIVVFTVASVFSLRTVIVRAEIIKKIEIQGLNRIERSTVMSYLDLAIDTEISTMDINKAVKRLYATQNFSNVDINITKEGILRVKLAENPVVNNILFGGVSSKIGDAIIPSLGLKIRGVYTKEKVKSDTEQIRISFQKSGKLNVSVMPKVEFLSRNRVNVLFDIVEGNSSRVSSIFFINNLAKTNDRLERTIGNRAMSPVVPLIKGKVFEEDSIDNDKSAILKLYMNSGFVDAAINYVLAEYETSSHSFALSFSMKEGHLYRFGQISIENLVPKINVSDIAESVIKTKSGALYNHDLISKTVVAIMNALADKGYAFVQIDPETTKDPDGRIVDVRYVIKAAAPVYIRMINIIGTKRTHDHVIRRELLIHEGDLYSRDLVNRSKIKLQLLNYFDIVEIKEKKTQYPDLIDLDVVVQDMKQTGSVSFSAGYSNYEGFIIQAGISKQNLAGLGYGGSVSTILSLWRRTVSLGFSNPHLLGTNLMSGFDIVYSNINPIYLTSGTSSALPPYIQNSISLSGRIGFPITNRLYYSMSLQYRYDSLSYDQGATLSSQIYKNEVSGTYMATSWSQTFSYDKRNNGLLPSKGFFASLTESVGLPLPYQLNYVAHELFAGTFFPLYGDRVVLSLFTRVGNIFGYNDTAATGIPYQYRYSLGYYNMRGFYFAGVGPHVAQDITNAEGETTTSYVRAGLRGSTYYVVSAELRMPTPLPKEYGLNFIGFVDIGSSFGIKNVPLGAPDCVNYPSYCYENGKNEVKEYVLDTALPRVAIGAGVLWISPMGPIRLEFAYAVAKQAYDSPIVVRLHFSPLPI